MPAGRVQVLTPPAVHELKRVLGYKPLKLDAARQSSIFDRYLAQTVEAQLPASFGVKNLLMPGGFPRCRDRGRSTVFWRWRFTPNAMRWYRATMRFMAKSQAAKFRVTIWNVREMIAALNGRGG